MDLFVVTALIRSPIFLVLLIAYWLRGLSNPNRPDTFQEDVQCASWVYAGAIVCLGIVLVLLAVWVMIFAIIFQALFS